MPHRRPPAVSVARFRCSHALAPRYDSGVAAVEFALIAPIMAVDVHRRCRDEPGHHRRSSRHADRRLHRRSRRASPTRHISQTEISDIMRVGSYILKPYSAIPIKIVLRNVTSSPASATNTKQSWTCTYNGTGSTQTCSCTNTTFHAAGQYGHDQRQRRGAEVTYDYVPLVFDYFMKYTWGGGRRSYRHLPLRRRHLHEAAQPERRCCCRPRQRRPARRRPSSG